MTSAASAMMGSSPRVRGTLHPPSGRQQPAGIIPACAGNTHQAYASRRWRRDHPRVCGEHYFGGVVHLIQQGSSPRVRGTPRIIQVVEFGSGIIPACAGNTHTASFPSRKTWDHPRVCGEHLPLPNVTDMLPGSSPRVRGTQQRDKGVGGSDGIIPACAGNTDIAAKLVCGRRDHPRVCGEHLLNLFECQRDEGSSPRVRGTPGVSCASIGRAGIIPACAGNTRAADRDDRRRWDHPRVCGEHQMDGMGDDDWLGSSPRVRGTRIRCIVPTRTPGIIPACAGNTPC